MIKKPYHYEYELRTNNLNYGNLLLGTYKKYTTAFYKYLDLKNKYGICEILKKRKYDY